MRLEYNQGTTQRLQKVQQTMHSLRFMQASNEGRNTDSEPAHRNEPIMFQADFVKKTGMTQEQLGGLTKKQRRRKAKQLRQDERNARRKMLADEKRKAIERMETQRAYVDADIMEWKRKYDNKLALDGALVYKEEMKALTDLGINLQPDDIRVALPRPSQDYRRLNQEFAQAMTRRLLPCMHKYLPPDNVFELGKMQEAEKLCANMAAHQIHETSNTLFIERGQKTIFHGQ